MDPYINPGIELLVVAGCVVPEGFLILDAYSIARSNARPETVGFANIGKKLS